MTYQTAELSDRTAELSDHTTELPDIVPESVAFIHELPEIDVSIEGMIGRLLQVGDKQVVFTFFDRDVHIPEHTHAEQLEIVLEGEVELLSGGERKRYVKGERFFIPAGTPHSANVKKGYKALVVFNEPDRYNPKKRLDKFPRL